MDKDEAVAIDIEKDRAEIADAANRIGSEFAEYEFSRDEIDAIQMFLDIRPDEWGDSGPALSIRIVDSDASEKRAPPPKVVHRSTRHIFLKWDRLLRLVPDVVVSGAAVSSAQVWLLPFIALHIALRIRDCTDREFTPEQATILVALWRNRDRNGSIDEKKGYEKANALLVDFQFRKISWKDFLNTIDNLEFTGVVSIIAGRIYFEEDKCRYIKHTALNV